MDDTRTKIERLLSRVEDGSSIEVDPDTIREINQVVEKLDKENEHLVYGMHQTDNEIEEKRFQLQEMSKSLDSRDAQIARLRRVLTKAMGYIEVVAAKGSLKVPYNFNDGVETRYAFLKRLADAALDHKED